jgi:hypothetical protein
MAALEAGGDYLKPESTPLAKGKIKTLRAQPRKISHLIDRYLWI